MRATARNFFNRVSICPLDRRSSSKTERSSRRVLDGNQNAKRTEKGLLEATPSAGIRRGFKDKTTRTPGTTRPSSFWRVTLKIVSTWKRVRARRARAPDSSEARRNRSDRFLFVEMASGLSFSLPFFHPKKETYIYVRNKNLPRGGFTARRSVRFSARI